MTTVQSRVEQFASHCEADIDYGQFQTYRVRFEAHEDDAHAVAIHANRKGEDTPYLFTKWSRSQLLAHLGTREKWFREVDLDTQASEINERLASFSGHRLRPFFSEDTGIGIIRGLVSSEYADIPDTQIMDALVRTMPKGVAFKGMAVKTDRALYVQTATPDVIKLPGSIKMYPGMLIRNSEVGYTSLWVVPSLWVPGYRSHMSFDRHVLLRKIHRGSMEELQEKFCAAITQASTLWSGVDQKMKLVSTLTFVSEDAAVTWLRNQIVRFKGSKAFAYRCEQIYRAKHHTSHSGVEVLEAMLLAASEQEGDSKHLQGAVVGAVVAAVIGL